MATYQKHNFTDGDILFAQQLNEMEDAIVTALSKEVEVDKSLTISGKAADAATVGTRLKQLEDQNEQSFTSVSSEANLPNYWLNLFNKRIPCVRKALMNAGWNKSAFFWYHDSHWTSNSRRSPQLLKYLNKKVPINKTNYGGDITALEIEELEKLSYLWDWRTMIREIPNHHSVPGNHDDCNATESNGKWWSQSDVYAYLLGPEEAPYIQQGPGMYYYIDNNAERTRYIYLDTATSLGTIAKEENGQLAWLRNTLITTPANWHIVAIAHIWKEYKSQGEDNNKTYYVRKKWDSEEHTWYGYKAILEFGRYNAREGIYKDCAAKVEFCIGGHTHWDADYVYEYGSVKIPVIITTCDTLGSRFPEQNTTAEMEDYATTVWDNGINRNNADALNTTNEAAVDAVIADYNNGYISIIRFGRGTSRKVKLNCELPIHELIEDAEVEDFPEGNYTNLLITKGFIEKSYVSTSGNGILKNNAQHDTTALIKANAKDTIYFANLNFYHPKAETNIDNKVGVYFYDSQENLVAYDIFNHNMSSSWAPKLNADGDVIQFTLPLKDKNYSYIRIVACDIRETSVITVNEWLGLDGTETPVAPDAGGDSGGGSSGDNSGTNNDTNNDPNDYSQIALMGKFRNVLPLAIGGKENAGYQNNITTNTFDGQKVATDNWDLSGLIPVNAGDVVRLYNVVFTAPTNYSGTNHTRILLGNSKCEPITSVELKRSEVNNTWNLQFAADGDVNQFTIPTGEGYSSIAYMQIVAKDIRGSSIITVNEVIDLADDITEDYSMAPTPDSTNALRSAYASLKDFTYDLASDSWNPPANCKYTNNGWGYTQNTRHTSAQTEARDNAEQFTTAQGWDTTGVFKAKIGTIVKLENIIFKDMLTLKAEKRMGCQMWGDNRYDDEVFPNGTADWKENYSTLGKLYGGSYNVLEDTTQTQLPISVKVQYTPVFDEYGDIVQFTMPRSISQNNCFISLTADRITKDSKIITTHLKNEYPNGLPDRGVLSKAYYYKTIGSNSDSPGQGGLDRGYNGGRGYLNDAICKIVGNPGEKGYLNYDLYTPGWSVTGYMPVTPGTAGTFVLNNIKVLDSSKENHAAIYLFDADFNHIHTEMLEEAATNNYVKAVTNNNITELSYPVATYSNVAYVRIAAADINSTSTITMK